MLDGLERTVQQAVFELLTALPEIEPLLESAYRQDALKRMLKAPDDAR